MPPLVKVIGIKAPGDLVRSDDLNKLVEAVDALTTSVNARLDEHHSRLDTLTDSVDELKLELERVVTLVNGLRSRFLRVTLRTIRQTYAIGEQAEILAQVTDIDGGRLSLPANQMPWVDFVSTWGQFKAASAFNSRTGAGERSISVQANTNGEARVLLRSDHVSADQDDDENEIISLLDTNVVISGQTMPMYQAFVQASTPANTRTAFEEVTARYESVAAVKPYLDTYYVYQPKQKPRADVRYDVWRNRWNDYHTTVTAFVKDDSDPLTADAGRGFGSIQVTFRDWISSWIGWDYFDDVKLEPPVRKINEYEDLITTLPYEDIPRVIWDRVNKDVRDEGLLGQIRDQLVLDKIFDQVTVEDPLVIDTLKVVKQGVRAQAALDSAGPQVTRGSLRQGFGAAAANTAGQLGAVRTQVNNLETNVTENAAVLGTVTQDLSGISRQVNVHAGSIDTIMSPEGRFGQVERTVSTLQDQIAGIATVDFSEFSSVKALAVNQEVELADLRRVVRGIMDR